MPRRLKVTPARARAMLPDADTPLADLEKQLHETIVELEFELILRKRYLEAIRARVEMPGRPPMVLTDEIVRCRNRLLGFLSSKTDS